MKAPPFREGYTVTTLLNLFAEISRAATGHHLHHVIASGAPQSRSYAGWPFILIIQIIFLY